MIKGLLRYVVKTFKATVACLEWLNQHIPIEVFPQNDYVSDKKMSKKIKVEEVDDEDDVKKDDELSKAKKVDGVKVLYGVSDEVVAE